MAEVVGRGPAVTVPLIRGVPSCVLRPVASEAKIMARATTMKICYRFGSDRRLRGEISDFRISLYIYELSHLWKNLQEKGNGGTENLRSLKPSCASSTCDRRSSKRPAVETGRVPSREAGKMGEKKGASNNGSFIILSGEGGPL
ncbi:hypothetical protein H6P81_001348 [Aristolochia fimbriata]|uniref:Uncharacterized protein n=1 Tax=Aristolochia fimbriata TaxID=158543 RepID=A0AAV7F6L3_ARIFI|nr:hypothetical protein H6P81_001348 [Aristolochia fimbriata]